jgi:hypothetical protein
MGDIVAKEVQIKVKLDISDAQRKGRILKTLGMGGTVKPGATSPGGTGGGAAAPASTPKAPKNIVGQAMQTATKAATQAASPISQLAQTAAGAAGAAGLSRTAGAVLKFGAKAAAAYGISRVAIKTALAYTSLLEGAAGGSDVTNKFVEMFSGLEAKVTAMESRVIGLYEAAARTKEIAGAAAQVSGQVPNVARIYAQQFEYSAQERNLEKAFERFKSIQTSKAIGREIGEAVRGGMGR